MLEHPRHRALRRTRWRSSSPGPSASRPPIQRHGGPARLDVVQEQRAGRERHQAAEPLAQLLHGVGDGQRRAERLRQIVEAVDLALRVGDVGDGVRRPVGAAADVEVGGRRRRRQLGFHRRRSPEARPWKRSTRSGSSVCPASSVERVERRSAASRRSRAAARRSDRPARRSASRAESPRRRRPAG